MAGMLGIEEGVSVVDFALAVTDAAGAVDVILDILAGLSMLA
jgi:hypothetical protein